MRHKYVLLLVTVSLQLITSMLTTAQQTKVRGYIMDSLSQTPLPFVNISIPDSKQGTITNAEGTFFLEIIGEVDTIKVSFLGYQTQAIPINAGRYQELHIALCPKSTELDAAIITPGENPALQLIRKVRKRKHYLNIKHRQNISYDVYNKVELAINNVDSTYRNNFLLRKFPFVFDYVDTSAITGKQYLPFFFSEAYSTYYYRRSPKLEKEIIQASKISGVNNASVSQLTGKMYQKINIYNNFLKIFTPGFVSPLANAGGFYYKYYLVDSTTIDKHWCYQVSFTPKRPNEKTFEGYLWIADTSFAVKSYQLRIAKQVNLNYINEFVASAEFRKVKDSLWLPEQELATVDFTVDKTLPGFFGKKTTHFDNYIFSEAFPDSVSRIKPNISINSGITPEDKDWSKLRMVPLTLKEQGIYEMIDSVQNTRPYERWRKLAGLMGMYHYELGKFEIGPYYRLYSFNDIEGHRFRFGGRTSNNFNKTWMLHGYLAYGEKDNDYKYGGGVMWVPRKMPRTSLHLQGSSDYEQLGKSVFALTDDNIFGSLLSRSSYNKRTYTNNVSLSFLKEWYPGLTHTLTARFKEINASSEVPFLTSTETGLISLNEIRTTEINLHTRYAKNEKYLRGQFERVKLGTTRPVFKFDITVGAAQIFQTHFNYLKLHTNISDKVPISPMGYFHYIFDAGYLAGSLPYPLLELHPANETYTFDRYAFNMMNYYEFASDRYASLVFEQHFQGFFFNKIPLIKRLYLREVVTAKGVIGSLSNRHSSVLAYPDQMYEIRHPYWEVSVGLENLLKLFRVDAVWRMSYLDHPDTENFGLRISLQVIL